MIAALLLVALAAELGERTVLLVPPFAFGVDAAAERELLEHIKADGGFQRITFEDGSSRAAVELRAAVDPRLVAICERLLVAAAEARCLREQLARVVERAAGSDTVMRLEICSALSGPALPIPDYAATLCGLVDGDGDGDVDLDDFGIVQRCFGGANLPPPAGCR